LSSSGNLFGRQRSGSEYATRWRNCKGAFFGGAAYGDDWVNGSADERDDLIRLAGRYLDLWVEHWSACLSSADVTAALTSMMAGLRGPAGMVTDDAGPAARAPDEPAPFRAAHDDRDGRLDELEGRIADLERRLAERDGVSEPDLAGHPQAPRRRTRKG
jgi:hypothetical protein